MTSLESVRRPRVPSGFLTVLYGWLRNSSHRRRIESIVTELQQIGSLSALYLTKCNTEFNSINY